MRLMVVASEFPPGPGGIGTHAWEVTRQLHEIGWVCMVLSAQDYAPEHEITEFNAKQPFANIRLSSCRGKVVNLVSRWKTIKRELRCFQPDIVLASGKRAVWLAAATCRQQRVPWIAVGHGTEFRDASWTAHMTRWAFRHSMAVVAVSEFTRRLMQHAGIDQGVTLVIPNGANTEQFRPLPEQEIATLREELGLQSAKLILTVGNVTQRKGQEVVVRALPKILERVPDAHYVMAGLPTTQGALVEIGRTLGVGNRMHFLGRIDSGKLVRCFNACDVVVMASRTTSDGDCEGYGIAIVEAALCGKPAVVSDNSGLAEAIEPEETGLVVPQEDTEATATAITRLLLDNELRHRMGAAARRRALAEQTWPQRVVRYDALLRQVVDSQTMAGRQGTALK